MHLSNFFILNMYTLKSTAKMCLYYVFICGHRKQKKVPVMTYLLILPGFFYPLICVLLRVSYAKIRLDRTDERGFNPLRLIFLVVRRPRNWWSVIVSQVRWFRATEQTPATVLEILIILL